MNIIFQIIIFILVLSFLVIIHEMGHLLAAKWAKIKVEEFGIGYPPRAFKLFSWGKVIFSLNWIPFGGFVKMIGEDGPGQEEDGKDGADDDGLAPFYKKSRFQRMVVILAGVVVNFIFGIIAFSIIFGIKGIPVEIEGARIGLVAPDSPAQMAGMEENTQIKALSFEDQTVEVSSIKDVVTFIDEHKGNEITVTNTLPCDNETCPSETKKFIVKLRTDDETPSDQGSLGVGFSDFIYKFYPWYEMPIRSIWFGIQQAFFMVLMILGALVGMVSQIAGGSIPQDVAGPVGIVDQAASSGIFTEGLLSILNFAAMISINLAVMNLLPIPALDGGRALFIILEKFFGKKMINKIEGYANYGGMIALLGLIVLITGADIFRIITR
ncbi:MAG: site-2 protease family protein [Candidatus Pacebacteria bacterium]|nr:site-2 protease family protein [Candidatus Paceibacterota bacterium]